MRTVSAAAAAWLALLGAGCGVGGPKTLDGFLAQAQREYSALAPSLEGAAARLTKEMRPLGVEYEGKPRLTWGWVLENRALDPSPDETTMFDVQATETVIAYEYRGVVGIERAPSASHPYRGIVNIAVTTKRRASRKLSVEVLGRAEPVTCAGDRAVLGPLPLLLPPFPVSVPNDYPRAVRELAQTAIRECLSSDRTEDSAVVPVTLRYSVAERTWIP